MFIINKKCLENTVGRSKQNTTFWVVSVENFPGATERLPDKVVLAYNLYGKSGNSRDSSNVYGGKGNTFEVLPFFPLLSKRPKFPEPSVWIISATLPPKIVNGTTQSHSCFR